MRLVYLIGGWLAVATGVAGVFLPLVPTTPLLLLAAWCFSRSSPRFHRWLMEHPRLGPPIRDWQAHGVIRRRPKILALVAVTAAALWLGCCVLLSLGARLALAAGYVTLMTFLATRPSQPPRQ